MFPGGEDQSTQMGSPTTTDLRCLSPAFLISATSALSRKVTSTDPGRDIYTDSWSGQFSMVAGSYSSLSSKTLMLLVSYFTSSGQRAKLSALECVPSLPPCYLLLNSFLLMCPSLFLSLSCFSIFFKVHLIPVFPTSCLSLFLMG